MYINGGKVIGFLLENQPIEAFITFLSQMLCFRTFIYPESLHQKNSDFIFSTTFILGYLMDCSITLLFVHNSMVILLKIMLQLQENIDII